LPDKAEIKSAGNVQGLGHDESFYRAAA